MGVVGTVSFILNWLLIHIDMVQCFQIFLLSFKTQEQSTELNSIFHTQSTENSYGSKLQIDYLSNLILAPHLFGETNYLCKVRLQYTCPAPLVHLRIIDIYIIYIYICIYIYKQINIYIYVY